MKTPHLAVLLVLLWSTCIFISCGRPQEIQKPTRTPLVKKDTSSPEERDNRLFVFVGQKLSFSRVKDSGIHFDSHAKAKYLILQHVYGDYVGDTIEFEAFDHYDRFAFADFQTAMIYVSEHDGKYYQEKYLFDPVAKTNDGRWAGPYSDEYRHAYNRNTTIKPVKIDFLEEIGYSNLHLTPDQAKRVFPAPYFILRGNRSVAVYGNYVPELFKLTRDGVLTARGLFSGAEQREKELLDTVDSVASGK